MHVIPYSEIAKKNADNPILLNLKYYYNFTSHSRPNYIYIYSLFYSRYLSIIMRDNAATPASH